MSATTAAPLLSARGVLAFFMGAGCAAFLAAFASFFRPALALPPLAAFRPLGAAFFWVAPLLRGGLLRRNCRALFRNGGGGIGGGSFCSLHRGESFLRFAHDDSSLRLPGKARANWRRLDMNPKEANGRLR